MNFYPRILRATKHYQHLSFTLLILAGVIVLSTTNTLQIISPLPNEI